MTLTYFWGHGGHKGQSLLDPRCRALDAMISVMVYRRLSTSLGSKTFNTSSLGFGNHNLIPGCRRRLLGHFTPPLGTLRLDAPALFRVAVPMMAINWDQVNQVLCPHSRCFGSYVDVIFLISSQPHHHPHRPSLAKSECAERRSYN